MMDQQFADINGIEYSLEQLFGTSDAPKIPESKVSNDDDVEVPEGELNTLRQYGESHDASLPPSGPDADLAHDASVTSGVRPPLTRSSSSSSDFLRKSPNKVFFAIVYLASGDYHRFHSPTAWVVEKRRHFVGELFSVSPYMAKRLENHELLEFRRLAAHLYKVRHLPPQTSLKTNTVKIVEKHEVGGVDFIIQEGQALQGCDHHCCLLRVDGSCRGAPYILCRHRQQGVLRGDAVRVLRPPEPGCC